MDSKKIDYLNIALIFISLFLAFKLPFELFLFSYAVLGPLHYLTEINWLNEKKFFVSDRWPVGVWILAGIAISIPAISMLSESSSQPTGIRSVIAEIAKYDKEIILFSLLLAIGMVVFKHKKMQFAWSILSIPTAWLLVKYVSVVAITVGVFLPTIIHVYLFTMLFMAFGAVNSKSGPGWISVLALIAVPFLIFASNINPANYVIGQNVQEAFLASTFQNLDFEIAKLLGIAKDQNFMLLSKAGLKIQVFIAFCYTYHYLNWFSKTTVIGWAKQMNKPKMIGIGAIWLISVALYWTNYRTGLLALFLLSFLHVLLEFPLNVVSVKGLIGKLKSSN